MKLSIKAIEARKPGAQRREFPDHIVPGLRLIVQPSGVKSFQLRYRYNGRGKRLALGRLEHGVSLARARDKARAALLKLADGWDPSHEANQKKAAAVQVTLGSTISALLDRYDREKLSQLR